MYCAWCIIRRADRDCGPRVSNHRLLAYRAGLDEQTWDHAVRLAVPAICPGDFDDTAANEKDQPHHTPRR